MTYNEIKKMFKDVVYWEARRQVLVEEFDNLDSYTGLKSAKLDSMIAGGAGKSLGDVIDRKDILQEEINRLTLKIRRYETAIKILDQDERVILINMYGKYTKKSNDICDMQAVSCSRRNLFYKKNKALNKIYALFNNE